MRRLIAAAAFLAVLALPASHPGAWGDPPAGSGSPPSTPPPQAGPFPTASPSPGATLSPGATPSTEATPSPADCLARPLDAGEREIVLRIAWRTLSGQLTNDPIKDSDLQSYTFTPCLVAPRGLFVTLRKDGRVRGMQGEIEASRPLYQQVILFTRRAATRDARFAPLSDADLAGTIVELSLIGGRTRVSGPAELQLDGQGVFLEKWGRRALFLPGVAAQQGWTAERTLDELCSQATLPKGSWSQSARIETFTTEVITGGAPAAPSPSSTPQPPPGPGLSGVAPWSSGRSRT